MTVKNRLTQTQRDVIYNWMMEKHQDYKVPDLNKLHKKIMEHTNKIIRKKYPEEDMLILRKYDCLITDHCLKFSIDGSAVFGFTFGAYDFIAKDVEEVKLAEVPRRKNCWSNEVFTGDEKIKDLINQFETKINEREKFIAEKKSSYRGFLNACKYYEDVENVVTIPDNIKEMLKVNWLAVINEETIATIKEDFK